MEHVARFLRSSHSQWQHLTESYVIGKFVNALAREYDKPNQMLEDRTGSLARPSKSSVQKRFDSSAYNQLRHSKPKSAENEAFAVTGRGENHPGRGGSRHGSGTSGGSQGNRGISGSGRHGDGGSDGGGSSGGGASSGGCSGSSSATPAKPGGETCWVCKSDQHYARDCPKQVCQECG